MLQNFQTVFRVLLGVLLLVFVGMEIFGWEPPPVSPRAQPLWNAIADSGYVLPAVACVYFLAGAAFVTNRFVPLASVVLFPVSLNIFLFHAVLNPSARSLVVATALIAANIYMLVISMPAYAALLQSRSADG